MLRAALGGLAVGPDPRHFPVPPKKPDSSPAGRTGVSPGCVDRVLSVQLESGHGRRLGATQAASTPADTAAPRGVPQRDPPPMDTLSCMQSPVGPGLTALPLRVVSKLAERDLHREDEPGEHDLDAKFRDGHVHLDADLGHAHAIFLEAGPDHSVVEDDLHRVKDEAE